MCLVGEFTLQVFSVFFVFGRRIDLNLVLQVLPKLDQMSLQVLVVGARAERISRHQDAATVAPEGMVLDKNTNTNQNTHKHKNVHEKPCANKIEHKHGKIQRKCGSKKIQHPEDAPAWPRRTC